MTVHRRRPHTLSRRRGACTSLIASPNPSAPPPHQRSPTSQAASTRPLNASTRIWKFRFWISQQHRQRAELPVAHLECPQDDPQEKSQQRGGDEERHTVDHPGVEASEWLQEPERKRRVERRIGRAPGAEVALQVARADAGRALIGVFACGQRAGARHVDLAEVVGLVRKQRPDDPVPDVRQPDRHPGQYQQDAPEAAAREAGTPGSGRGTAAQSGGGRCHERTVRKKRGIEAALQMCSGYFCVELTTTLVASTGAP